MKKIILISLLVVVAQSCSNYKYKNFNKQKYTSLHPKKVTTQKPTDKKETIKYDLPKKNSPDFAHFLS